MWNGKLKAVTFSFDDGVTQDIKMIELLDKYGLKATFNLNSGKLGEIFSFPSSNPKIIYQHNKNKPEDIKEIYKNHEVAAHTCTHKNVTTLSKEELIKEVEEDRKELSRLVGYEVIGMAYPCGGVNNSDEAAQIIKENTGIRYSRTITSSHNYELPPNLLRLNPSVSHSEGQTLFDMAKEFIALKPDRPQLFYIWGHSYECDGEKITWEKIEEFFKLISGHDDIYYCTNKEALDL